MNIASVCKRMASWLGSLMILLLCLYLGEFISTLMNELLPGSILGMLLLAALLGSGLVRLSWVESGANFLIRWMSLLFVPIGVGAIDHLELLHSSLVALLLCCIVGTVVVMAVAGWMFQWLERY
ncbi:CidA/LrgA family protein [Spongorhabdus nitratireducens]